MTAALQETVLVIGATSSLAQVLCHKLCRKNYALVLAGRGAEELALLAADLGTRFGITPKTLAADFLDSNFSPEHLIRQAGDFDHIIIATGDMGSGDPANLVNLAQTTWVNYTVPAQIATAAALSLSEKQSPQRKYVGSIVLISSIAGDRGRQSNYAYGSAKAALNAFASGLRNRFFKQGVHVVTVKPGFLDTPMTWGMQSPLIASREIAAEYIIYAMKVRKNIVYVPFFWRYIMLIIIHIPEAIFKRLKL